MTDWFHETLFPSVRQSLRINKVIHKAKTQFQDVLIFENEFLGRVLVLDNIIQTTEADEFYYHEMLSHVPIMGHGAINSVLIVGGGDGGMLKEVLKHPVEKVVLVDIDGDVVDICCQHLPAVCGDAFSDPRTELVIGDGKQFVASTDQRFDLVIVDSTDPVGPGESLFGGPFYRACHDILNDGGVIATQNGVPFFQSGAVTQTYRHFRDIFVHFGFFASPVPMYVGGHMAFGWASDRTDLSVVNEGTIRARLESHALDTRYYNSGIHVASFALPTCVQDLLV